MFDIKTLKATPGLARRLIQFSQMNQMTFDQDLVDIAMSDLLSQQELNDLGFYLDPHELNVLQHIKDWKGRAIVLTPNYDTGRNIAMAHLATSSGKSLILAAPNNYLEWVQLFKGRFPDKKLSVFGNPRYHDHNGVWPIDIKFTEAPDLDADVFITSYGGMIWNNLITSVSINQTIVEELDHLNAVNYKWQESLMGLFHEIPAPLFLQNLQSLPREAGLDIFTSLQVGGGKTIQFLTELVTNYMWAGMGLNLCTGLLGANRQDTNAYLNARGYHSDILTTMSLLGISSELITKGSTKQPMVFSDQTIRELKNIRSKKTSGLNSLVEREASLEDRVGQSIRSLTESASMGDKPSLSVLGDLQTSQWANLKARHIKDIHFRLSHSGTRAIFVTDNRDLIRSLHLHFGDQIVNLDADPPFNKARFLYGAMNSDTMLELTWQQRQNLKPIKNIIVHPQHINDSFDLLKTSDFVVMPQWVQSLDDIERQLNAVYLNGARPILPYIQDTFECYLYNNLMKHLRKTSI